MTLTSTTASRGLRVKTNVRGAGIRCPDPDSSCTTSNHALRVR